MKLILVVLVALAGCIGLWFVLDANVATRGDVPSPASGPGLDHSRIAELEAKVDRLEHELQRLVIDSARAPVPTAPMSMEPASGEVQRSGEGIDARWYLKQYMRSFERSSGGSEYFRLAVDAYAIELLHDICHLLRDGSAHPQLRVHLAAMLGTPRFALNANAIDALFALLRTATTDRQAIAALDALKHIGDTSTGITLERTVWSLGSLEVKKRTLGAVVGLLGPDANRALQRLFASATTIEERTLVIAALSTADADAALEVFRQASTVEDPVRLQSASAIQRFRGDAFKTFIEQWLGYEQNPQVRQALGEARTRMIEPRPYAAQKATGPPDAEPNQDHPNAWATQQADGGLQWLELTYKPARRASGLRIYEVCVPGAVVKVTLVDEAGTRHDVWSGVDPTNTPGVFEVRFATTSYRVKAARIVLDTNKRPGWSEIDAVELIGPDGNAWATDASASSSYGQ